MIVQIYEIQTPREASIMIQLDVDHVGSVLLSGGQWQDPVLREAIHIVKAGGGKSSIIPLFGDIDLISRALDYYRPDIVHFCETLPYENDEGLLESIYSRQVVIGQRFKEIEIMRSIPIGEHGHGNLVPSLQLAKIFEPISHWFLTDTLLASTTQSMDEDQPVSGYVGITGVTCDWEVARQLVVQSNIPVILAGGLGPDNVSQAIAKTIPAGVDSCTHTNEIDSEGNAIRFKKDTARVMAMVNLSKNGISSAVSV